MLIYINHIIINYMISSKYFVKNYSFINRKYRYIQKILKPISSRGTDGSVVGIAKGKSVIIALLDEYGVMGVEGDAAV